jgi:hypothetical protein
MKMNIDNDKPDVCDDCGQGGELQWNEDLNKWVCEFCEEFIMEEEWENKVEQKESSKYVETGMSWKIEFKQNKKYKPPRKENRNEF